MPRVGLKIVHADSDTAIFTSKVYPHPFGNDPLLTYGLPFRVRNCLFPVAGLYWIQFWYDDAMLAQQDLFLR